MIKLTRAQLKRIDKFMGKASSPQKVDDGLTVKQNGFRLRVYRNAENDYRRASLVFSSTPDGLTHAERTEVELSTGFDKERKDAFQSFSAKAIMAVSLLTQGEG